MIHHCTWCNKDAALNIMPSGVTVPTVCSVCGTKGPSLSHSELQEDLASLRGRLEQAEELAVEKTQTFAAYAHFDKKDFEIMNLKSTVETLKYRNSFLEKENTGLKEQINCLDEALNFYLPK